MMAVCSVHQQLHDDSADDIRPHVGMYDYVDEYAECLGIRNIYPPLADSFDGLDITGPDVADTAAAAAESHEFASNRTTRLVIYPWMKRRQHRNGNIAQHFLPNLPEPL